MKIGDKVSIRVGRSHDVMLGTLASVYQGIGRVVCGGVVYVRSLKRIKPAAVGIKERAAKAKQDIRRNLRRG